MKKLLQYYKDFLTENKVQFSGQIKEVFLDKNKRTDGINLREIKQSLKYTKSSKALLSFKETNQIFYQKY